MTGWSWLCFLSVVYSQFVVDVVGVVVVVVVVVGVVVVGGGVVR